MCWELEDMKHRLPRSLDSLTGIVIGTYRKMDGDDMLDAILMSTCTPVLNGISGR